MMFKITKKNFCSDGSITWEEYARRRKQGGAAIARSWKQLRHAERSGDHKAIADAAISVVYWYGRGARLPVTLQALDSLLVYQSEIFWPVLLHHWTGYEQIWRHQDYLVELLQAHSPRDALDYYSPESVAFYNSLAPRKAITVYRGCCQNGIQGIAWTTDREVAAFFAARSGHGGQRGIATGLISKRDFWKFHFASADRDESEIVCEPEIVGWQPLTDGQLGEIMSKRAARQAEGAREAEAETVAA
jgi:hypothetical protein